MLARLSMALSPDLVQHIDSEVIDALVVESPNARLERLDPRANQSGSVDTAEQVRTDTSSVRNFQPLTSAAPDTQ